MDIEVVKTITDGLVEVAKILGPAIITALVAYKAGKWQIEEKLKELDKAHAYSASEKLFDYYQNQEKELTESYKSIGENMGFLLGMTSASPNDEEATREIQKMYDLYERILPNQIKLTLRGLKKYELQNSDEFRILEGLLSEIATPSAGQSWGDKIFRLLETYGYLQMCNKMILEEISTNYMKIFTRP